MKSSIKLGKVFGIPIGLNFSWFISLGFVVLMLALRVYPDLFPSLAPWTRWGLAIASALLFFASIVVHELAHSLVARHLGIPVKGITLFVLGGVARIAREAQRPLPEFVMAAVGPLTSLLLAGFFLLLWFLSGGGSGPLPTMWQWLWIMNLVLGLFNLMPGFPLDGGRLLRAALWGATGSYQRATRFSTRSGQALAFALMATGIVIVLGPEGLVLGLGPINGLWLALVGMFLNASAVQSYYQVRLMDVLRSYRVADAMSREPSAVEETMTVAEALARYGSDPAIPYLLVKRGGVVTGAVDGKQLLAVPPRARADTTLGQVMTPAAAMPTAHPNDDMAATVQRLEMEEASHMPVVEGGRVIGLVGRDSVLSLLRHHPELRR